MIDIFRYADPVCYLELLQLFRNNETNKREMGKTYQKFWAFP